MAQAIERSELARAAAPPDIPAAAVEQLPRLSDAFDRFLEGVADNRQVAFVDAGWRLKTDAAERYLQVRPTLMPRGWTSGENRTFA